MRIWFHINFYCIFYKNDKKKNPYSSFVFELWWNMFPKQNKNSIKNYSEKFKSFGKEWGGAKLGDAGEWKFNGRDCTYIHYITEYLLRYNI